ncbi:cysteine-tryptophan domain-containing zinc finger protein 5-like isoform X2 [Fagus crenata]
MSIQGGHDIKKMKLVGKLKHENGADSENDMTLQVKKISVIETKEGKEFMSDDLKCTLFQVVCDVRNSMKAAGGAAEVFGKVTRMVGKRNPRNIVVENICEDRAVNSHKDVFIECRDDGNGRSKSSKEKVGLKATFHEDDETSVPCKSEKLSFERKNKSKGIQSNVKPTAVSTNESSRFGTSAEPNDKKSTSYVVLV